MVINDNDCDVVEIKFKPQILKLLSTPIVHEKKSYLTFSEIII